MNKQTIRLLSDSEVDTELISLIENGSTVPLIVTGSSMLPFLQHKLDTVWLVRVEGKLYRGQILFFRRTNGSMVLHRIRRILPDGCMVVNGDAQVWCEVVRPEQAVAVVSAVTRNGKMRRTDSLITKVRDAVWYPTRPFRPLIFKVYGFIRKIFP